MPLYEYRCNACGHNFEKIQKFSDPPVDVCPNCGERSVEKLLSSPAIQFKGTGWYITDYARKGAAGADGAPKPEGKAETKPAGTDAKTTSSDSSTASSSSTSSSPSTTTSTPTSSKTS